MKVASTTATGRLPLLSPSITYVPVSPSPFRFVSFSVAISNVSSFLYQLSTVLPLQTQYWLCFAGFSFAILVFFHISRRIAPASLSQPNQATLGKKAGAYLPSTRPLTKHQHHRSFIANKHQLLTDYFETTRPSTEQESFDMAGGKGKSSGGKSSGGKVGADGGKKQQSHSSKAGLQVSSVRG